MGTLFAILGAVLVMSAALVSALPRMGARRQPRLVAASEMPRPQVAASHAQEPDSDLRTIPRVRRGSGSAAVTAPSKER